MLEVLHEDDDLLFVNKPPGIVVQRGYDPDEPVLLELAEAHTGGRLYLLQRLDRGTSGVMFFSKNPAANASLTRQFEKKRIRKRYVALCEGELAERQTIDAPIARAGAILFAVRDHGKRAVTHVAPLVATPRGSVLSIVLETGRTHQIRVHLAAVGHPLAGDWLYGERNAERPLLHAAGLEMTHPLSNTPLRVQAPLPADFIAEAARRRLTIGNEDTSDLWRVHVSH